MVELFDDEYTAFETARRLPLQLDVEDFETRTFRAFIQDFSYIDGVVDRIEVVVTDISAPGMAGAFAAGAMLLTLARHRRKLAPIRRS